MTQIDEDILLLKLIREDDKLAFKYLFHKYMDNLCQFIDFFIHDKAGSEDLALDLLRQSGKTEKGWKSGNPSNRTCFRRRETRR